MTYIPLKDIREGGIYLLVRFTCSGDTLASSIEITSVVEGKGIIHCGSSEPRDYNTFGAKLFRFYNRVPSEPKWEDAGWGLRYIV